MRLGRALTAGVATSLVLLAGCSDDPKGPVILPSSSEEPTATDATSGATSATSEPSAEPTPTTTLVLPDEHVESVDAFVQEFFAAYNAAQDSRDLSAFDAMYLPQCTGCVEMRDELAGWLADGGTVDGADWVILQQSSFEIADTAGDTLLAYRASGTYSVPGDSSDVTIPALEVQLVNVSLRPASPWIVGDLAYGDAELP